MGAASEVQVLHSTQWHVSTLLVGRTLRLYRKLRAEAPGVRRPLLFAHVLTGHSGQDESATERREYIAWK